MNWLFQALFLFIGLALGQILLFNQLAFFAGLIPYIYLYFLLVYPFQNLSQIIFLLGFILGIIVDVSFFTGGIHAGASILFLGVKNIFYKIPLFGLTKESHRLPIHLNKIGTLKYIRVVPLLIFIHHLYVYLFQNFSLGFFHNIGLTLLNTLVTFVFILMLDFIFDKKLKFE